MAAIVLKARIIPKLLLRAGRNVKGVRFERLRDTGHPVTNARIYDAQGADELIFLDITASIEGRDVLAEIVSRAASEVFMPFCVGGGVRSVADFRTLLLAGADKIAVNTAAVERPGLLTEAATLFGVQCVVVSIDFRSVDREARVYTHGGSRDAGVSVMDHVRRCVDAGAGELLLTSIDRDGTMTGYDL